MKYKNTFFKRLNPQPYFILFTVLFFIFSFNQVYAQDEGSTCDNPIEISDLPFNDSGNTADYGNNYNRDDVPEEAEDGIFDGTGTTNYLDGYEAVYAFTPSSDELITITTEKELEGSSDWPGLYVFTGCPFSSTIAYHTAIDSEGGLREIEDLPVTAGETYYIVVTNWYDVESDYTIDITKLEDCTEADAGEAMNDFTVCAETAFTLENNQEDLNESGLSYQWEESTDGDDWTAIEGADTKSYTVSNGITEETFYRLTVTCEFDGSDTSDPIEVTLKPYTECFCIPEAGDNTDEIRNFTLSNINNDSEPSESEDGYSDYTENVEAAELIIDEEYVASITSGTGAGSHGAAIWIDYNDNGIFEEDEMVAYLSSISASSTVNFPGFVVEDYPGTHRLRVQYTYSKDGNELDPGEVSTNYSETEDYMGENPTLDDCEEPVSAGTPTETSVDMCPSIAFTLTVENSSPPANGLDRQWQSSPAGEEDWSDIEGANSSTLNLSEGIEEATDYRFTVTCNEGETAISDIIEVSINPAEECYCVPEGTNENRYINSFTTSEGEENISNTESGFSVNGYGEFLDMKVSQLAEGEVSFEAEIEGGTAGFRIWIDWNQDGVFDEDEVAYSSSGYSSSHQGTISIPEDAQLGETRMRIASHWSSTTGDVDPCETDFSSGEFEDYTFEVIPLEDCSGTPDAGMAMDDFSVCEEVGFELFVEHASERANGLERIWQSSVSGEDDWTDIEDANDTSYFVEDGITEAMEYRYKMHCEFSDETVYSESVEVSLSPENECYCAPEGTNSDRYIDDFVTSNGQENISNLESGFSAGGYGEFMDLRVSQVAGHEVSFEADVKGGTAGFRIWVDWDQDGVFDQVEEVAYTSSGYSGSPSGSFTIPENAEPGETRMRIASHYLNSSGDINPCETGFTYGEFEDYTFEVIPLEDCTGTPNAGIAMDDFSICDEIAFELSVEEPSEMANGLERVWQSSVVGEDDWTDIEEATVPTYFVEDGITEDMEYRFKVHCEFSDETDYSEVIAVSLKPATECYCIPTGSSDNGDEIVNFTLENLDNDSTQDDGDDGYSDLTHLPPAELIPGLDYVAELTSGSGTGNHGAAIWIDYNQNGEFDQDEMVTYLDNEIPRNETVEFPAFTVNAAPGIYTLRVQYHYNKNGEELDPCETTSSFSETEDLLIEVVVVDCFPHHNILIVYINDISAALS